jgi:hypothetical protein
VVLDRRKIRRVCSGIFFYLKQLDCHVKFIFPVTFRDIINEPFEIRGEILYVNIL